MEPNQELARALTTLGPSSLIFPLVQLVAVEALGNTRDHDRDSTGDFIEDDADQGIKESDTGSES